MLVFYTGVWVFMDIYVDCELKLGDSLPPRRLLQGVEKYKHLIGMLEEVNNDDALEATLLDELDLVWWGLSPQQVAELEAWNRS